MGDYGLQGAGDGGLRVMRLVGQGAGRGYNGDVHHKETKTRRDVGTHKEVAEYG